jgi:rhamnogalacturonyl hydrolase YesR
MDHTIETSFRRLRDYCEQQGYKGWDPFDGLSSKVFQSVPFLYRRRFFRLAWIQFFKRSPINFRRLAAVPKEYNAKGLALFLTGFCHLYAKEPSEANKSKIIFLADTILQLQNTNYSGSCWGYYFDWQARAFFQPANTPTVVATSFVADALWNAYEVTGESRYYEVALSSVDFILKDLNRTYDAEGNFAFSYSPLDKTQVFNASLLGARLLARAYSYTKQNNLKEEARKAVRFVCNYQQPNGAWAYGTLPFHQWVDNFHTGFNLECIYEYGKYTGDENFINYVEKGFDYYINTFFNEDGAAKYYNNKLYPIDIHSPAQLIATLVRLHRLNENKQIAQKAMHWTIKNMQDQKGYFYYQKKKWFSSKISYMRWAQAWMFYAMSLYEVADN